MYSSVFQRNVAHVKLQQPPLGIEGQAWRWKAWPATSIVPVDWRANVGHVCELIQSPECLALKSSDQPLLATLSKAAYEKSV